MTKGFKCTLTINKRSLAQEIPDLIGVVELPEKRYLVRAWVSQSDQHPEIAYLDLLRRRSGIKQIMTADMWNEDTSLPASLVQLGEVMIENIKFGIGVWRNQASGEEAWFDLTFVPMPAQSTAADGQGRQARSEDKPRWGRLGL